ncbi:MAG: hypothetical protein IJY47_04660 [Clostridia bacterium]|nr:hypothetical protein [Clostridia bacterium]
MKRFRYEITEEIHNDCTQASYGIEVYEGETGVLITSICDISCNRQRVVRLADQCNRLALSPIHLRDVIEDFLLE